MKKACVIRFPGTNCDRDVLSWALQRGLQAQFVWHADRFQTKDYELVLIPGGFSYGDYLRSGALAAKSPVIESVREFSKAGRPVFGICNGFQILCEAGLLPGALVKNQKGQFIDDWVSLKVQNDNPMITPSLKVGEQLKLPIAHGDGKYVCDELTLKKLQDSGQIWLTYLENPNGSLGDIAGIMNQAKNVSALMPHPERAQFLWQGATDGAKFL
jgi:phosphoribosylformylglycinamidine synthase I